MIQKQLKSAFELRSIEDDVLQNKEDIVDLRVNDGRHDMLLSQEMNQINYINNTIIPSLDHKLDVKVEELHQYDSFIDSTRPPIGSIVAWIPAYSAKVKVLNVISLTHSSQIHVKTIPKKYSYNIREAAFKKKKCN